MDLTHHPQMTQVRILSCSLSESMCEGIIFFSDSFEDKLHISLTFTPKYFSVS